MSAVSNASVSRTARALCRALHQDLGLSRAMLALANAETRALRENDAQSVQSIQSEMQALLARQQAADAQREEAVRALARALGMNSGADRSLPPLSEIILRAPLSEARPLLALRSDILAAHAALQQAGERNRALLANALMFVHLSLAALTGSISTQRRYGGSSAGAAPTLYVDRKC
jgi:hypothetical protein